MQLSTAPLAGMLVAIVALGVTASTGVLKVHEPPSTVPAELRSVPRPIVRGTVAPPQVVERPPAPPAVVERPPEQPQRPPALPRPADVVTAYYAALDARRFEAAWRTLGPAVHARFGGFAAWRAGFATTRSSRPLQVRTTQDGGTATVEHVLEATDRTRCGIVRRTFDVRWRLVAANGRWTAKELTGVPRGAPAAPCVARP